MVPLWVLTGLITVLSGLTYFLHYQFPARVFWDENYHIASAQKYINGVFFMEQHPPLGKLLIAAGEKLLHPNAKTDQYIDTDYAQDFPEGFSFSGYRLFPALFGWATGIVIFFIFILILGNRLQAALLSLLYIFDNALIVHSRGAMLEPPFLFFSALTILAFLIVLRALHEPRSSRNLLWGSALFGMSLGLIAVTKLLGLVLILFVPAILWKLRKNFSKMGRFLGIAALSFLIPYVAVWQMHFTLGKTIRPLLPDQGYYQASPKAKNILAQGKQQSPLAFPVMLRDALNFVGHYNNGVPRLDLCKADENGSPFFLWPFGARTIDYRWETLYGSEYRYLYLQSNPVGWAVGLAGVVLSATLLLASVFFPREVKLPDRFLLSTMLGLYIAYMVAIARIDRVLYLYHYFLPLIFSFLIFAIAFKQIRFLGPLVLTERRKTLMLGVLGVFLFLSFQFYRPFTYYEPLSKEAFQKRSLLELWELHCVGCDRNSPLVVPDGEE